MRENNIYYYKKKYWFPHNFLASAKNGPESLGKKQHFLPKTNSDLNYLVIEQCKAILFAINMLNPIRRSNK